MYVIARDNMGNIHVSRGEKFIGGEILSDRNTPRYSWHPSIGLLRTNCFPSDQYD